jgi:Fumarylacetoacetate (FAA) hydrolase family
MRLARHGDPGQERPIVSPAGSEDWYDLSPVTADIDPAFFAGDGVRRTADAIAVGDLARVPDVGPVRPPDQRHGQGRLHRAELQRPCGGDRCASAGRAGDLLQGGGHRDRPRRPGAHPPGLGEDRLGVELAVVIGGQARYLDSPEDSAAVIAGFAISDDVSEREFQLERSGQWDKGKSCETFNPFGPWIRTADEVPDPQDLSLRLWVNGVQRQNGSTRNMVFGVHHIVWYVSQFMVLRPGDVINTGTPAGVALGLPDHPYLRQGDIVQTEIDGLGRQRHVFGQA